MANKIPDWVAPAAGAGIAIGVVGAIAAYVLSQPKVEGVAVDTYTPDQSAAKKPAPPAEPIDYTPYVQKYNDEEYYYKDYKVKLSTEISTGVTNAQIYRPNGTWWRGIIPDAPSRTEAISTANRLIDNELVPSGSKAETYRGYTITLYDYTKRSDGPKGWGAQAVGPSGDVFVMTDSSGAAGTAATYDLALYSAKTMIDNKLGPESLSSTTYNGYTITVKRDPNKPNNVGPVSNYAVVIKPDGTERNTTGLYNNCRNSDEALAIAKKVVDQDVAAAAAATAAAAKKAQSLATITEVSNALKTSGRCYYKGWLITSTPTSSGKYQINIKNPDEPVAKNFSATTMTSVDSLEPTSIQFKNLIQSIDAKGQAIPGMPNNIAIKSDKNDTVYWMQGGKKCPMSATAYANKNKPLIRIFDQSIVDAIPTGATIMSGFGRGYVGMSVTSGVSRLIGK